MKFSGYYQFCYYLDRKTLAHILVRYSLQYLRQAIDSGNIHCVILHFSYGLVINPTTDKYNIIK